MSDDIMTPVEGRFIFQVEPNMRVRFNGDGWVEELGNPEPDAPLGTRLQARQGTARDDLYARRYYDLYSRVVFFDIHSRVEGMVAGADGAIPFRMLEAGSRLFERLNKIIAIGNSQFNMNVRPLE